MSNPTATVTQADLVREAMRRKGLDPDKPTDLARATGLHQSLCGRYLAGKVAIGGQNAPRVAQALDLELMELLYPGGVATPPDAGEEGAA